MKRILFVDDEQRVLDGLRASLRKQRRRWEMVFVNGGQAAIDELEQQSFDVVVTDMRMPGIDGAALLRRVQELRPETVRIVLSGHAEEETTLRSLPVAHQFLSKPCDASTLENVIERACNVQNLLEAPEVRARIGQLDALPSLPRNYAELNRRLVDPNATYRDLAAVIERDIAMSAKLLQIVNSAFFGLSRRLTHMADAISYLGLHVIKNLVLSIEVFGSYDGKSIAPVVSLERLTRHSLLVARIARRLLTDTEDAKDAFAAAVLHDVGKLILASNLPEVITQSVEHALAEGIPLHEAERELHGFGHSEVGAYLLGRWGLPYPVIEAVAYHHTPECVNQSRFDLLSAVHVADALASRVETDRGVQGALPLDEDYLDGLGVLDQLDEWRAIAASEAEADDPEVLSG